MKTFSILIFGSCLLIAASNQNSFTRNSDFEDIRSRLNALEVIAPPGTIIAFAGKQTPPGYLLCDGKSYAVDDPKYSGLFMAIGQKYGWNVIVIGAGAAGLTVALELVKSGVEDVLVVTAGKFGELNMILRMKEMLTIGH